MPAESLQIRVDDLSGGDVIALLEEHLADMYATSPPECVHALDVAHAGRREAVGAVRWHGGLPSQRHAVEVRPRLR